MGNNFSETAIMFTILTLDICVWCAFLFKNTNKVQIQKQT